LALSAVRSPPLSSAIIIGSILTGLYGFLYFALMNSLMAALIVISIILSFVPHDLMYGPQAALIAEGFTPRLRYSGTSIGYQLASLTAARRRSSPSRCWRRMDRAM
jgi:hypothetical protein